MAYLYKRGEIWWGRFNYKTLEFRKSLETDSKPVARERAQKWEGDTKAAHWGEGAGKTFDDAMVSFLETHCPTLKPSAARRYQVSAKPLTKFFTGMALSAISSSTLHDFTATRRAAGVTAPSIRRDLACLSSMYTHAIVDKEWCEANPVLAYLKRQKRRGALRESPPRTRYLSQDEESALLAAVMVDKNGKPLPKGSVARAQLQANAIAFAIDTGLRAEEQWSLTWDRVDLKRRQIVIPKEIAKSHKERRVPLFPRAAQILAQLPKTDPKGFPYKYVWVDAAGNRFIGRRKGLQEAAKRAKIASLNWHDLRRTCGCRLIQVHKFTKDQVQEWMGHESVAQTESAYAFLAADALQKAVQKSAQMGGFRKGKKRAKRS
jgi:integrase/recombinase XerD